MCESKGFTCVELRCEASLGFVVFIIEVMGIADSFACVIKWSHAKDMVE